MNLDPDKRDKIAPALVAFSDAEDEINCLLADASAHMAELPLALPVN